MDHVGLESYYSLGFRNLLHLTNAVQNLQFWSEMETSIEF